VLKVQKLESWKRFKIQLNPGFPLGTQGCTRIKVKKFEGGKFESWKVGKGSRLKKFGDYGNTDPSKKAGQISRIEKFKVPDSRFLFCPCLYSIDRF